MFAVDGKRRQEHTMAGELIAEKSVDEPCVQEAGYHENDSRPSLESRLLPRLRNFLCLVLLLSVSYFIAASCQPEPREVVSLPPTSLVKKQALSSSLSSATPTSTAVLRNFEVDPPVQIPSGMGSCQQTLMEFSFAQSFGTPFVGSYTPPSCSFNKVVMNFTVTSQGRQFDRLALMYLSDTEVWRTSTSEPSTGGIVWTYMKDMTTFMPLWKQPQKLIFSLDNNIDSTYTAPFNTTLIATFYNDNSTTNSTTPADMILPVSAKLSGNNQSSAFRLPQDDATTAMTIPQNVKKAIFTISSCGQADEEFWWSNVLNSEVSTFSTQPNLTLLGQSPFREVQLYIDGAMAGVAMPFPVIFTGGIVPGFWRPVTGINVYDLREDEIDVTPWLGQLCDGKEHTFNLKVQALNDTGNGQGQMADLAASNWVVTGKLFLWLDAAGRQTTSTGFTSSVPAPNIQLTSTNGMLSNGTNDTLNYNVQVDRHVEISSTITTSEGETKMSWMQDYTFSNTGMFTGQGENQDVKQVTSGTDVCSTGYKRVLSYPLNVFTGFTVEPVSGNQTVTANMDRGRNIQVFNEAVFPTGFDTLAATNSAISTSTFTGTDLQNRQNGSATIVSVPQTSQSFSSGSTDQNLVFSGMAAEGSSPVELFSRGVAAANSSVLSDRVNMGGTMDVTGSSSQVAPPDTNVAVANGMEGFARIGVQSTLGRGPRIAARALARTRMVRHRV